jgi:hypothetical protein
MSQTDIESAPESLFTQRLTEVMHGRQLRKQRERDRERERYWMGKSVEQRTREVEEELAGALDVWRALDSKIYLYRSLTREGVMAKHLLQWHARTVVHLYDVLHTILI